MLKLLILVIQAQTILGEKFVCYYKVQLCDKDFSSKFHKNNISIKWTFMLYPNFKLDFQVEDSHIKWYFDKYLIHKKAAIQVQAM